MIEILSGFMYLDISTTSPSLFYTKYD